MPALPTVQQVIDAVQNEDAGWLDTLLLYWDSLYQNEKEKIFAILQSRGGGGGGSGVTITSGDGFITIDDGLGVYKLPTLE